MKLETILLIAAAGVAGYVIATKKKPAAVTPSLPTATPNVIVEEYDFYDYGPYGYPYGYPMRWGGRRWGGGGGGGHHGGGHGGHGGGHH